MAYEVITIKDGSGVDRDVVVDTVSGDFVQIIKLDAGGDGASVPIVAGQQVAAASIPVVLASNQPAVPVSVATPIFVAALWGLR